MEFYKALEEIRITNRAAYALTQNEKAFFIIKYNADPERDAEILIHYSKDLGDNLGEEDVLNLEESLIEFPFIENLDFILIRKKGMNTLDLNYDFAIKRLIKCEIA